MTLFFPARQLLKPNWNRFQLSNVIGFLSNAIDAQGGHVTRSSWQHSRQQDGPRPEMIPEDISYSLLAVIAAGMVRSLYVVVVVRVDRCGWLAAVFVGQMSLE